MTPTDMRTGRRDRAARQQKAARFPLVFCLCLASIGLAAPGHATNGDDVPAYRDTRRSAEERAADLIARMTLDEKAFQLATSFAPAIPRLEVQQYIYQNEAAHGINNLNGNYFKPGIGGGLTTPATSYPTALSITATWDPELIRREGAQVGNEARAFLDPSLFGKGNNNLGPVVGAYGYLTFWAPTVNMLRDPRWGRTDEGYGEDPFLAGTIASAYVQGLQGANAEGTLEGKYLKAIATAKHFALNNNESGRMTTSSDTDEGTIRDYYTAQFRILVEKGRVGALMSSYNAINSVPAVANNLTLNLLARRTWGFDGHVTSDCGGVGTIRSGAPRGHDWAPPGWTTDRNPESPAWTNRATGQTVSGKAGAEAFSLRAGNNLNCQGNGGQGYPPAQQAFAKHMKDMNENSPEFIREAIAKGILTEGMLDRALHDAFVGRFRTGEFDPRDEQPYTRISKDLIESEAHKAMAQSVAAQALVLLKNEAAQPGGRPLLPVDPGTLKNVVIVGDRADVVNLGGYSGAPKEQVSLRQGLTDAILAANPSAKVTFDACGTSPILDERPACSEETLRAIASADLIVAAIGTSKFIGEGGDRKSLKLPGNIGSLVPYVAGLGNSRIAVVVQSPGTVLVEEALKVAPALLYSAPNGQRQGRAAADVLFGKVNPSGRLPFTWYKSDADLPPMLNYNIRPSQTGGLGRTYQYFAGTPTFPFGYGLSYTTFSYTGAAIGPAPRADANGQVRMKVTVRNTGSYAGATVVEAYASPPAGAELPYRLVGFKKTAVIQPGASEQVEIVVPIDERLRSWDPASRRAAVPNGKWEFSLATAARSPVATFPVEITGRLSAKIRKVTFRPERMVLRPGESYELLAKNPMLQGLAPTDISYPGDDVLAAVRADDSFADLGEVPVKFTTSNARVLRVDRNGRLTAREPGTATVSAAVGGKSGSTVFVVR